MVDEINNVKQVCQKGFEAYLIGGFGADINEVEAGAWEICKQLYNFSERKRIIHYRDVESIVNTARSLSDKPKTIVSEIHKILFHMPHCNDGITRIIFAHSHGAKIVRKALDEKSLLDYFIESRQNANGVDFSKKLKQIKDNLAVFTLGGIDTIPKEYAKICLNMRLKQDINSEFGNIIYGESSQNSEIIKFHNGEVESSTTESKLDQLKNFCRLKTLKRASTEGTKHVLFEYTKDAAVMGKILQTLMLESNSVQCGCSGTTTKKKLENKEWNIKRHNITWSHGAKIVRTALEKNSLHQYFIKYCRPENGVDFTKKLEQIKDNLAVFTLGGIDTIPKGYAKLTHPKTCFFVVSYSKLLDAPVLASGQPSCSKMNRKITD
ncbi:uncharacterized protein LOC120335024 [Styela clava]